MRVDAGEFIRHLASFPNRAFVWAELGVNEGETFRALRLQKQLRPDFKRFITIHDAPRFVHSPFAWLERFGTSFWRRAFRRAFNLTLEPLILQQALKNDDEFLCLTTVGRDQLNERLQRLLRRRTTVHFLPHVLYLDDPLPKRTSAPHTPARLGFFGFITPNKGLHLLIDAAISLNEKQQYELVPNINIRGRATEPYLNYLNTQRQKVQQAKLTKNICFGDFLPDEDLPTFLNEIDFLALPYDAPPVIAASGVLQWARTYGVPVVASATPAFSSLITHMRDGVLIPSKEFPTWEDFFVALSTQKITPDLFTDGIKARQAEASWKRIAEQVLNIISRSVAL